MFLLWLLVLASSSASFALNLKGSCEEREQVWCGAGKPARPVCGTDDRTYGSRCELVREQCRREASPALPGGLFPKLYMKNKGPCRPVERPKKQQQSCWASKSIAERSKHDYVPRCQSDGTFAPLQCHKATNTCWCVNTNGKPISKMLVKNGTPNCSKHGKRRKGNSFRGGRHRKECGTIEKSNFFTELDNIYKVEYNRTLKTPSGMGDEEMSRVALNWKFSTLDEDGNLTLSKNEYSSLRRLIKKVVKPRECARSFLRLCDTDSDSYVTLLEWKTCHSQPRIKRRNGGRKRERNFMPGVKSPPLSADMFSTAFQEKVPLINSNIYGQSAEETVEKQEHQEVNDCLTDKRLFLEELKQPNDQLYVPQCTPDGRYQRIQCYNSTGYCWCVHEDTGKPIPGTSVKDLNPNCDAIPSPPRPMKGCPEPKKQAFLKDLMEFMNHSMKGKDLRSLDHSPGSLVSPGSAEEMIATWNFLALDENKNKVLERKEWKAFRTKISTEKKLRRCGKKLPRYCDVNHDKKITLTEWLNCVRNQKTTPGPDTTVGKDEIVPPHISCYCNRGRSAVVSYISWLSLS